MTASTPLVQEFGPLPAPEVIGWTGTGNHDARPVYGRPKAQEGTPIYDQLRLERTIQDPDARRLATAIITDADSRKLGLPWLRFWRG